MNTDKNPFSSCFHPCNPWLMFLLAEGLETLSQRSLPACKHRRIAQRVRTGLGFPELLDQIEKVSRVIGLKRYDEFLIVESEGVGSVKFN